MNVWKAIKSIGPGKKAASVAARATEAAIEELRTVTIISTVYVLGYPLAHVVTEITPDESAPDVPQIVETRTTVQRS